MWSQRVDAAKPRIEELNPLVAVEARSDVGALHGAALDALVQSVDIVVLTDHDRETIVRGMYLSVADGSKRCSSALMTQRGAQANSSMQAGCTACRAMSSPTSSTTNMLCSKFRAAAPITR